MHAPNVAGRKLKHAVLDVKGFGGDTRGAASAENSDLAQQSAGQESVRRPLE